MDDLISRKAALDAVEKNPCNTQRIYEALKGLPSAEQKTFRVYDITTGKEADPYEIALHEDWAKGLMYCDMEGFAVQEDGTLFLMDECGKYKYCPEGRYKVVWDE